MKKFPYFSMYLLCLTCIPLATNAQISFEKNYSHSVYYKELSPGEEKLFLMDIDFSECRIYNLDHSLYKTIKIHLDPNYFLYDISYVTRKLFNNDDKIELLYVAREYFDVEDPYYQYMVGVVDEDGMNLLEVPEGTYYEIVEVDGKKKLLVWLYDFSTWPYFKGTNIYNIESESIETSSLKSPVMSKYNPAYPNPAADQITLPFNLPENNREASLKVFSPNGSLIKEYRVDHFFRELLLDVSGWPPGIYHYSVNSIGSGKVLYSQKFAVVR